MQVKGFSNKNKFGVSYKYILTILALRNIPKGKEEKVLAFRQLLVLVRYYSFFYINVFVTDYLFVQVLIYIYIV